MAVKVTSYSGTISALGPANVTIQMPVPGSFVTADSTQPNFSGRNLLRMNAWLENRSAGDAITALSITDVNNVLGLGANHVVQNLFDTAAASGNQTLLLPPDGPFMLVFPSNLPTKTMVPSGLYLIATFTKFAALSGDTAGINLAWDDLT